jgi:hypothetical protein
VIGAFSFSLQAETEVSVVVDAEVAVLFGGGRVAEPSGGVVR